MKKIMTYLLISVIALIAIIFGVGLALPKERTFTKTTELKSDISSVFGLVTDFKNQPGWRNDIKEIIVIYDSTWDRGA